MKTEIITTVTLSHDELVLAIVNYINNSRDELMGLEAVRDLTADGNGATVVFSVQEL